MRTDKHQWFESDDSVVNADRVHVGLRRGEDDAMPNGVAVMLEADGPLGGQLQMVATFDLEEAGAFMEAFQRSQRILTGQDPLPGA